MVVQIAIEIFQRHVSLIELSGKRHKNAKYIAVAKKLMRNKIEFHLVGYGIVSTITGRSMTVIDIITHSFEEKILAINTFCSR